MPHVPTEQLPLLAGVALGGAVLLTMATPMFRDPSSIAALEAQTSASSSSTSAAPHASPPAPPSLAGGGPAVSIKRDAPPAALGEPSLEERPVDPLDMDGSKASEIDLAAASTVEQLTELARRHPSDERAFVKLARAHAAQPDGMPKALATLKTLFAGSAQSLEDKELQAIVTRAANGPAALQEQALAMMASDMGRVGPDLLYELTAAPSVAKPVKQKALELTKRDDVRKLASPALLIALDLRDHPGCGRAPFLERAEKHGDKRSLAFLTPLQARKGCGLFNMNDCYACLGNRAAVNKAVEAIKAR